jgi:hypothetical protein
VNVGTIILVSYNNNNNAAAWTRRRFVSPSSSPSGSGVQLGWAGQKGSCAAAVLFLALPLPICSDARPRWPQGIAWWIRWTVGGAHPDGLHPGQDCKPPPSLPFIFAFFRFPLFNTLGFWPDSPVNGSCHRASSWRRPRSSARSAPRSRSVNTTSAYLMPGMSSNFSRSLLLFSI